MSDLSIWHALRSAVAAGRTPDEAVDHVLGRVTKAALANFVRPLMLLKARQYERNNVRDLEEATDRLIADGTDPLAARAKLAGSSFAVAGRYVDWLEATAEDHEERARWLRARSAAMVATAQRHEEAARMIREAGVACLADLTDADKEAS